MDLSDSPLRSSWLPSLCWAVLQSVIVVLVLRASVVHSVVLLVFTALVGLLAARRGVGLVLHLVAVVLAAAGMFFIELVLGPARLSPLAIALCFACGYAGALVLIRGLVWPRVLLLETELPALVALFLLVARWPQRTPLDFLGLFKFEDNAAWIGIAAQFLSREPDPIVTGVGAVTLRPVMAVVAAVQPTSGSSVSLSNSYVVTGVTYQLLILLAAALAGSTVARLLPSAQRSIRVVTSVGGAAVAYVLIGLPLSTGHLTFIGALVFLWAALSVPSGGLSVGWAARAVRALLLLGAVGMWWPLVPVLLVALAILEVRERWAQKLLSRLRSMRRSAALATISAAVIIGVAVAMVSLDLLPLSLRGFFEVKGGLQPLPSNLVPLGLLGAALLFAWGGNHRPAESWMVILVTVVLYAFGLVVTAQFIGPDYAVNYSPAKLLLLVAVLLSPFMLSIPAFVLRERNGSIVAGLVIALALSQGWLVSSWSLNNPRTVAPPAWGQALLNAVDASQATVLCLTAVPERRIDAYECSRHASALTNFDFASGAAWRHMVLFPAAPSAEGEERVAIIRDGIAEEISQGGEIVFLSIDPEFVIAPEDVWWMAELPRSEDKSTPP